MVRAMSEQIYTYVKAWRYTRYGGYTRYVAVCNTCKAIVPPVDVRTSKGKTHGEMHFAHEHVLSFIGLLESNSGRRKVSFEGGIPEELKKAVLQAWLSARRDPYDVMMLILEFFVQGERCE